MGLPFLDCPVRQPAVYFFILTAVAFLPHRSRAERFDAFPCPFWPPMNAFFSPGFSFPISCLGFWLRSPISQEPIWFHQRVFPQLTPVPAFFRCFKRVPPPTCVVSFPSALQSPSSVFPGSPGPFQKQLNTDCDVPRVLGLLTQLAFLPDVLDPKPGEILPVPSRTPFQSGQNAPRCGAAVSDPIFAASVVFFDFRPRCPISSWDFS